MCPCSCGRPLLTLVSAGNPKSLTGRSCSICCGCHCSFPWVLVHRRFCLCPPSISVRYEILFQTWLCPSHLLLCPWIWGIAFFGGIQRSPVQFCSAASCDFGILAGEDGHMSFYSAILEGKRLCWIYLCVCVCFDPGSIYSLINFFFPSENDGRISLAGGISPMPVALWLGLANVSCRLATERLRRENLDYFFLLLSASGSFARNTYISTVGPSPTGNIHLNTRLLAIQGSRPK